MFNYLSKFAPIVSDVNAPLRHLLKDSSEFVWDTQHDEAFKAMKEPNQMKESQIGIKGCALNCFKSF